MERRFSFRSRLEQVEAMVGEMAVDTMADSTSAVWREVLQKEVLPWLRCQIASRSKLPASPDQSPGMASTAPMAETATAASQNPASRAPPNSSYSSSLGPSMLTKVDKSSIWFQGHAA